MTFAHRRLIAYQRAVEFVIEAYAATQRLPLCWRGMVDQIRRAATSVPLNIAEGVSETSPREQRRFLRSPGDPPLNATLACTSFNEPARFRTG